MRAGDGIRASTRKLTLTFELRDFGPGLMIAANPQWDPPLPPEVLYDVLEALQHEIELRRVQRVNDPDRPVIDLGRLSRLPGQG